jgi:two-component system, OmpR family, phosphate regulon sensor histidine kinase PhoR
MQAPWKRSRLRWPITLSASLIALNVTLMICWIVLFVRMDSPGALTMGVIAFALILIGLSFWLVLTIKEIQLNNRQANFVDSVTHELKSPIAALQLYLETLQMRSLDDVKREEFHAVMEKELHRLDQLINQLLEVGRLDAIGQQEEMEDLEVGPIVERCIRSACLHHGCDRDVVFRADIQRVTVHARPLVVETIYSNLVDNAVKYAGVPKEVRISVVPQGSNRIRTTFTNNGPGVPPEERKKIFRIFYRGGSELKRTQKGTGLGLFIVHTLVRKLKGRVMVRDREDGRGGCEFVLDLPGRSLCDRTGAEVTEAASKEGAERTLPGEHPSEYVTRQELAEERR